MERRRLDAVRFCPLQLAIISHFVLVMIEYIMKSDADRLEDAA